MLLDALGANCFGFAHFHRDPAPFVTPFLEKWRSIATTPDFVVGDDWIQPVLGLGLGAANTPDINEPWTKIFRRVYSGAEGLRKLRMATICIAERDGLLYRLGDVKCPIHWLHVSIFHLLPLPTFELCTARFCETAVLMFVFFRERMTPFSGLLSRRSTSSSSRAPKMPSWNFSRAVVTS